jgi:hypothetical protein
MSRSLCWLLVVPALFVVGCGTSAETVGQVRDRHRAPLSELRAQLKALKVPADTSGATVKLDPAPVYAEDGSGNTDFLAVEHLGDSDARLSFDMGLSGPIETVLAWTGATNVDDPSARREATPDVEATFKQAQAIRYLVVLRASRTPVSADRNIFAGGDALIDAFVVDLKTRAIVASTSARGAAAAPVQVDLPAGPARTERANTLIMNAVMPELRKDLAAKLSAATGGRFGFGKRRSVLAASS